METRTQPEAQSSEEPVAETKIVEVPADQQSSTVVCFVDGIPASYDPSHETPFYKAVGANRAHRRRNAKKIERLLKVHKHQGTAPRVLSRKEFFEEFGQDVYLRAVSP